MEKEGYHHWGKNLPGFQDFWAFLHRLVAQESTCSCREETCGAPFCAIRTCARERDVDVCAFCDDYPCRRVEAIARGYPTLLADGRRMKDIGLEAWIEEQEERAETGFAYVDIRCHPYEVPDE
jgi:hypothetical protein